MSVRLAVAAVLALAGPAAASPDPAAVAAAVDRVIDARLAADQVPASPPCTDAEFLRRATVDILGRTPTPDRVRAFLADRSPDKRAKLVDELLASPEAGRYFASVWYGLLVKDVYGKVGPQVFENWLADRFNAGTPWDRTVRDILTARGRLDASPPAVVWYSHAEQGMGREQATHKPADVLGTFAQKFLGRRLQCAECHDHPFTGYKQDDFWAAAALVGYVRFEDSDRDSLRGNKRVKGDKVKVEPKLPVVAPEKPGSRLTIAVPEKGRTVAAKLPDGSAVPPAGGADPRQAFADWAVSPTNRWFAEATANRVWAHFLGRGFVDPVDDFQPDNPPSHPAALAALADAAVASRFDLKSLIRAVCRTKAYQRSSDALPGNAKADAGLFARAAVRPMSPDVLFHAAAVALGGDGTRKPADVSRGKQDRDPATAFAKRFRGDDDEDPDLGAYAHGVPQVLYLLNGGLLDGPDRSTAGKKRRDRNRDRGESAGTAAQAAKLGDPGRGVELLFLAAYGRPPTAAERAKVGAVVSRHTDPAEGYQVALWALLNTSEFQFNH